MTRAQKYILPTVLLITIAVGVSLSIIRSENFNDAVDNLGAAVVSSMGSSSSSSGPCSGGRPCCGGRPYSGFERCCNGVIYDSESWQGINPDGSISDHDRVCCGGRVVVVGNDSRWVGTICCQNINTVKTYNRRHWDCSSTGICLLNETRACGGCANQPNPLEAPYCIQLSNAAYMVQRTWNNQTCAYNNPQWTSCGGGARCNSTGTACQ